jgi:hypothetical protein
VGIGTVSANEKLTVVGAGKFTGQANTLDQTGAYIDYASGIARITGQATTGGTLAFFTNPNGGFNAERMRINSSGNVGVGTTNPSNLRVTIEGNSNQLRIRNTTTRYRSDYFVNSGGETNINSYDDAGGVFRPFNLSASKLSFLGGRSFFAPLNEQYSIGVGYNESRVSSGAQVYYIGATDSATPSLVFSEAGGTERMRLDASGSLFINQSPGQYTIDTTNGATSIANGGTVNFVSVSGMLLVNSHTSGAVTLYVCGGGSTAVVGGVGTQVGTLTFSPGISGYTWTNNSGSSAVIGFMFFRTRPAA